MKPHVDNSWIKKVTVMPFSKLLIIDNHNPQLDESSPLIKQLDFLMAKFGSSLNHIKKAYAVYNEGLALSFDYERKATFEKHRKKPDLFKKKDWRNVHDPKDLLQRFRFHDHLEQMCQEYSWNSSNLVYFIFLFFFFFFLFPINFNLIIFNF